MKLNELMEVVHSGYPDGLTRLCWDEKKQQTRSDQGDTLAAFIVAEIADTYDGMATTDEQLDDALDALRWAAIELGAVISALEKRKDPHAKEGERPCFDVPRMKGTEKDMAGEYRAEEVLKQLPEDIAQAIRTGGLRIAVAAQPMVGVVRRPDLSERLAAVYSPIAGMAKYADGLKDGSMVPVVALDAGGDRIWAPGELYFKS